MYHQIWSKVLPITRMLESQSEILEDGVGILFFLHGPRNGATGTAKERLHTLVM